MGYAAELPERWIGRQELDLIDAHDRWAGSVEFIFRMDTIELRLIDRMIAAIPRGFFRYWLSQQPNHPYIIDDVVWWVYEGQLLLWIRGMSNYGITPEILHRLRSVT